MLFILESFLIALITCHFEIAQAKYVFAHYLVIYSLRILWENLLIDWDRLAMLMAIPLQNGQMISRSL
jgi:hypothetical protein